MRRIRTFCSKWSVAYELLDLKPKYDLPIIDLHANISTPCAIAPRLRFVTVNKKSRAFGVVITKGGKVRSGLPLVIMRMQAIPVRR